MKLARKIAISVIGTLSTLSAPSFASEYETQPLVFGLVSENVRSKIGKSTPFINYIASHHPDFSSGSVRVFQNYNQLAFALSEGEVHLATATAYNALFLKNEANAVFLGNRWKKGQEKYSSVFFSRTDSQLKSLDDLKGKSIAFEKRQSTSGHFIPAITMLNHGLELQHLRSADERPDGDNVGYLFIDDHLPQSNEVNLSIWVFQKKIDAAVFSDFNWNNPTDMPVRMREQLTIFASSKAYPRDIVISSPTLSATQTNKIQQILFDMDKSPEGQDVLKGYQATVKIAPFTAEMQETLEEAKTNLNRVK